jgi:hypothetical protein
MARKAILETGYTFTPSTNTIIIPRAIQRERLILITNVTTNTVIYNFSDSNLKATAYTVSSVGNANTTTVVLNYNTASMSSTDKLQITVDEYDEKFTPSEIYQDPVNKFRTSSPQALIDTDFEYGTQISKWENLALINNRPFSFPSAVGITGIGTITLPTSSRTVTVVVGASGTTSVPGIGTAITVQDTYLNIANGNFIVESVGAGNTNFTYTARATNTGLVTSIFDPNKTNIFTGTVYTGAAIGGTPTFAWTSGQAIPVTTTVPHGLAIGNEVAIVGTSQTNANGSYTVAGITSSRTFTYYANTAPAANPTGGIVYVRPQGQFLHRPFDGGVFFTSNATSNFEAATRQTRRYFRYQSGKGIQVSSGTILKPNLQLDSLTASGTSIGSTITVQTKEQHNIQASTPGTVISISGANETGYNGTYAVTSVTGYNTFNVTATAGLTSTTASGPYSCNVTSWYGCSNRLGTFDAQNGIFFEFDGQTLSAVRRSSTFQLAGKVSVTNGSNTVTQTNSSLPTAFAKQLNIGDFIVLRGQSYRVVDIASDNSMTISPSYRGATADYVIISKTVDTKYPQSSWNIDKCDGTGPSGYNIDLTKMQMFYMDYSWYGAGFIRWGFRGPDGNVFYVHKVVNNNVNTEAYMRSGNLPARYESESRPPTTYITTTVGASDTFVGIASTAGFPSAGTLCIRNADTYEYVNYTGIGTTAFTGLTRGKSGNASLALTVASGSNVATVGVGSTANLQVGQRVISSTGLGIPDGTYISALGIGTVYLSQAATALNPTVAAVPMGASSGQTFTYSALDPTAVEFAFPTYGPSISHWGTSVIMDGRFDDDKSLVFTYGQSTSTGISSNTSRALFSIRVAPSVDNGISASFGARELINRMQLTLKALDVSAIPSSGNANLLVQAYLNSTPVGTAITWTNAVGNATNRANSSLAQIADYSGGAITVTGGEITAGFFVGSGANSIDLSQVRDLGNCILGGGGATSATNIYPDGPDTLTIVVTNLASASCNVFGRLSWTEAQA